MLVCLFGQACKVTVVVYTASSVEEENTEGNVSTCNMHILLTNSITPLVIIQ